MFTSKSYMALLFLLISGHAFANNSVYGWNVNCVDHSERFTEISVQLVENGSNMLIAEKNRPLLSQYTGPSTVNRSAKTISFKGEMSNASLIIERSTLEDYTHANGTLLLFGEKIENLDCKISAIFME